MSEKYAHDTLGRGEYLIITATLLLVVYLVWQLTPAFGLNKANVKQGLAASSIAFNAERADTGGETVARMGARRAGMEGMGGVGGLEAPVFWETSFQELYNAQHNDSDFNNAGVSAAQLKAMNAKHHVDGSLSSSEGLMSRSQSKMPAAGEHGSDKALLMAAAGL